jgi:hypothetical protein
LAHTSYELGRQQLKPPPSIESAQTRGRSRSPAASLLSLHHISSRSSSLWRFALCADDVTSQLQRRPARPTTRGFGDWRVVVWRHWRSCGCCRPRICCESSTCSSFSHHCPGRQRRCPCACRPTTCADSLVGTKGLRRYHRWRCDLLLLLYLLSHPPARPLSGRRCRRASNLLSCVPCCLPHKIRRGLVVGREFSRAYGCR